MSIIPVSAVIISLGVVGGVFSILFRTPSIILWSWFISAFVAVHDSAAYVMIGVMHTSTNRHIVAIFMWLNSALPARLSIVWRAASTLPLVFLIWFSIVPLLLVVTPRYL